jgi:pyruvate formate lyase activating enzyme
MRTGKDNLGLIFHAQRYSIQDGPGLRTTIFMKGCPLRCEWCHNPESIKPYPELMSRDRKCLKFGKCVRACPTGAITLDQTEGRKIDREKCTLCFDCVSICPTEALEKVGVYVTVDEVMAEIEKDELFYRKSGGGVTISGGEPLLQGEFVHDLLQACKQRHLHTALDTSGYAHWSVLKSVLEYVDLVLYDVKHMDLQLHKQGTGVGNSLILTNLHRIPPKVKVWLRLPLIARYNDSHENVRKVAELALEVKAEKISALLYHEWATGKYSSLGREYSRWGAKPPSAEHVQQLKNMCEDLGVKFTVGY